MRRTSRKDQPPGTTELIIDHDYYDRDVVSGPRWLRALQIVGLVAVIVATILYRAGYLNDAERDWTGMALGAAVLSMLVGDVRRGRPSIIWARGYRRSSDPVGFWVIMSLYGLAAGVCVVASVGDLLGVGQLPR